MVLFPYQEIHSDKDLIKKAKLLVGKKLIDIEKDIKKSDTHSRVTTKSGVGYVMEGGVFGISRNSSGLPDIEHLGIEIKTSPLKYKKDGSLTIKEPLSLNIINYIKEEKNKSLKDSSLYKKNKKILFFFYIHDENLDRSQYPIKYVFLWEMDDDVLKELEPDYKKILDKIKRGRAHEIHQSDHKYLTICPKHGGTFKDSSCTKSKTIQPYSNKKVEVRAFRLKNKYMNLIVKRNCHN